MIFVNVQMNIDHICHAEMFYNASLFFFLALLRVAQLLYLLGSIGTVLCCGSAFILAFRQYATPSGEMFLAAGATGFCE